MLLLGLAPAAHGANRTGRMFTGDRSGDFLFAALHAHRLRQPADVGRTATTASRCTDCFITAAVRCAPPANKPLPAERDDCSRLARARAGAADGRARGRVPRRVRVGRDRGAAAARRSFGHGAEARSGRFALLGCFHPSQQNTFTGKLTAPMIDAVLRRARELAAS